MDVLKDTNEESNQINAIKAVKLFKKKRKKTKTNLRKRTIDELNTEEEEEQIQIKKKQKTINKINTYTTDNEKLNYNITFENSKTAMSLDLKDLGATRTNEIDAPIPKHKKSFFGPKQASANIRVTCRFDYQPDICKDWKETGYCGYGDTCKFLHDRGDYKSGLQLEKEWEEKQKFQVNDAENYEINEDDEDDLPFACFICRDSFIDPVVTHCEHYFCERCILQEMKKSKRCPLCKKNTDGIFRTAKNLIKRLKEEEQQQE